MNLQCNLQETKGFEMSNKLHHTFITKGSTPLHYLHITVGMQGVLKNTNQNIPI